MIPIRSWPVLGLLLLASLQAADFQREVRPILAKHCFKCHGPDENTRKAKLRLDQRPDAEQLQQVLERIDHAEPEELMPPMTAETLDRGPEKSATRLGTGRGGLHGALGVHCSETIGSTQGETGELGAERARPVQVGATGSGRA